MADLIGVEPEVFSREWHQSYWDREVGRTTLEDSLTHAISTLRPDLSQAQAPDLLCVWMGLIRERIAPRTEVSGTLRSCREKGVKLGLLSNAGPAVPPVFHETPFSTLFDASLFSCQAGVAKPDAAIYEAMCARLRVAPAKCVFVGDGGSNELQGAMNVGMTAVMLRIDSEIEEEGIPPGVEDWAGPVIQSLEEVQRFLL